MAKFAKVHNHIINTKSISTLEFISDDIFLGDFPTDKDGKVLVDFIHFLFGKITLFSGEEIELTIDLYQLEEGQTEEDWYETNRDYKHELGKLTDLLEDITQITEYEYKY